MMLSGNLTDFFNRARQNTSGMSLNNTKTNYREAVMKSLLALFALLAIACNAAFGATVTTYGNNFTMLAPDESIAGGTNDVVFTWDGTLNTDPTTAVANASISSSYPFFGYTWSMQEVKIYGPGSYTLSTADSPGGTGCPTLLASCASGGNYNVTVLPGQIMGHMKGTWNGNEGMDVVNIWDSNAVFSPLYAGPGGSNSAMTVWSLMSIDGDGDGINGLAMIDGAFAGFSVNFNLQVVPIPAAAWLFGSGLVGIFGLARQKRRASID
jgi:hypothetical protein